MFKQGYDDFLWDRGIQSQDSEYLKGYEYSRQERIMCRGSCDTQKPSKRIRVKIDKIKSLLAEGLRQCDIARIVDVSESYVCMIKNGKVK